VDVGSARRKAATYTGQYTQNKSRQTSTPWVELEPTILVFERAKTVHAIDRAATVIGSHNTEFVEKLGERRISNLGYGELQE
jgi:hypothetical protein